jgi:hypothetical protein
MENDYLFSNHVSYRLLYEVVAPESAALGSLSGAAYS